MQRGQVWGNFKTHHRLQGGLCFLKCELSEQLCTALTCECTFFMTIISLMWIPEDAKCDALFFFHCVFSFVLVFRKGKSFSTEYDVSGISRWNFSSQISSFLFGILAIHSTCRTFPQGNKKSVSLLDTGCFICLMTANYTICESLVASVNWDVGL